MVGDGKEESGVMGVRVLYIPLVEQSEIDRIRADAGSEGEFAKELMNFVRGCDQHYAHGCFFVGINGRTFPVLLYRRAEEIYEHIMRVSGGRVSVFFRVCVHRFGDNKLYGLCVFPNVRKFVEVGGGGSLIIYLPLVFIGDATRVFNSVVDVLPKRRMTVGLLDVVYSSGDRVKVDDDQLVDKIKWLRALPVREDESVKAGIERTFILRRGDRNV